MAIATTINLSSLDGNNGFRLDGGSSSFSPIRDVSAGDVNGDGFSDLIIGKPQTNSYAGTSYVVFGKAAGFDAALNLSSLDGSNGFSVDGKSSDDYSGRSVSSAGDVNGDGFDDVIIGAPGYNRYGYDLVFSTSYVVFGKASGFDATLNLSNLDGNTGFRLDEEAAGDFSGSSVSGAGDVNGDGFADVIVGAPGAGPNGVSYVVFGKASGFDATMGLSSLDGNNGFRLDGSSGPLSNAGDVNGDGFDDVIIGAPDADPNGDYSGSSYVVFGKAAGFGATLSLSSLDGNNGFRLDGEAADDVSGRSVSGAGDVNGDGFDDLIIGAPSLSRYIPFSTGKSYVVFGKAAGFDAAMDLSSLDGSNGFRLDGESVYGGYGGSGQSGRSVSGAGDVNGDGFDDLIVGAPYVNPNGGNSGSSYVVFGKAAGFDATLNLSNLDSNTGISLDGGVEGDFTGSSVSGAGDVNGDGFDDVIIGAPGANRDGDRSGVAYVLFGSSQFDGTVTFLGTPGDDFLKGTSAAEIFEAGDGNDRMIGRGGADVFHGDAGDDYIQVTDLGFASVDGRSGNDTLHTDGKDLNLDLGLLGDKIHGIETICLYGRGDNELTLTTEGLLNLSDTDNSLRVNGNAGDHITVLDDGWVDEGNRGQGYFHVYTNDEAVLLVGMNVTIDFV